MLNNFTYANTTVNFEIPLITIDESYLIITNANFSEIDIGTDSSIVSASSNSQVDFINVTLTDISGVFLLSDTSIINLYRTYI